MHLLLEIYPQRFKTNFKNEEPTYMYNHLLISFGQNHWGLLQLSLPFFPANKGFHFDFGLGCLCLLSAHNKMMGETNRSQVKGESGLLMEPNGFICSPLTTTLSSYCNRLCRSFFNIQTIVERWQLLKTIHIHMRSSGSRWFNLFSFLLSLFT